MVDVVSFEVCKTTVSVDRELPTIEFIFCKSWDLSRIYFVSTFVYLGNGCSDRRYEGWFINGVVV